MRFNSKHTIIEAIEKGKIENVFFRKKNWPKERCDLMVKDIVGSFEPMSRICGNKIQYITATFFEAFEKAKKKIAEITQDEALKSSGTFMFKSNGYTKTIMYSIDLPAKSDKEEDFRYCYMEFLSHKDVDRVLLHSASLLNDQGLYEVVTDAYEEMGVKNVDVLSEILLLAFFLKFCETETKVIQPKEKYRDKINTKYFNETKSNIEILDSRWFTDLVVSGEFNVRGHFRLQPYGEGLSKKKIIWIDEFKKSGYHRKAKVQNQ